MKKNRFYLFVIFAFLVTFAGSCDFNSPIGESAPTVEAEAPAAPAAEEATPEEAILHLCEIAGVASGDTLEVNGKLFSCQTGKEVDAPESATPIPQASPIPATPSPMPVLTDNGTADCKNHGTVAWQNDNQVSGESYGEAPVGGLDEPCWVVGQTWWIDANGTSHRAVFAVAPHTVAWLSGHKGGTGWYFGGSLADVKANLAEQSRQLLERDGEMDTLTIILPDDAAKFPILTRFSQKQ